MRNLRIFRTIFQGNKLFSRGLKTNVKSQVQTENQNFEANDKTTHFGFETVKASEKTKKGICYDFEFKIFFL